MAVPLANLEPETAAHFDSCDSSELIEPVAAKTPLPKSAALSTRKEKDLNIIREKLSCDGFRVQFVKDFYTPMRTNKSSD